jgi:hypothetical protein
MFLILVFDSRDIDNDFSHSSAWIGFTSVSLDEHQYEKIHLCRSRVVWQSPDCLERA